MKNLDAKKVAARNKRVDMKLLRSVLKARKKLRKSGWTGGSAYNLVPPFSRSIPSVKEMGSGQAKSLPELRTKR
jgi:hypothetical protein